MNRLLYLVFFLFAFSGCSTELKFRDIVYDLMFITAIITIGTLVYVAVRRPSQVSLKKRPKKQHDSNDKKLNDRNQIVDNSEAIHPSNHENPELKEHQKKEEENDPSDQDDTESIFVTDAFDDFFPLPRKFNIVADPGDEDKYHRKLNYHYIIEKLTRKLYYLLLAIALLTVSFTYVLYKTSIAEQITPDPIVMNEYETMMKKIMRVEDALEDSQIKRVERIDSLSTEAANEIKVDILTQTVDYEDKLISEVNSSFFRIYYWRYALVRFLIAFVIIAFIRYLMVLYMRIRADRNDLIRKEEALSILFYTLEQIRDPKKPLGDFDINKIPNFPLRTLFSSPDNTNGRRKAGTSPDFEATFSDFVDAQNRSVDMVENLVKVLKDKL